MSHPTLAPSLRRWSAALMLALTASAADARTLDAVDFVALDGDRVLLTLTLSDTPPQPAVFSVDKPARLSIDLGDTALGLSERSKKINVGVTREVKLVESGGRTRVVVDLSESVPYTLRTEGNNVIVEIAGKASAPKGVIAGLVANGPVTASGKPAVRSGSISNVDFRRGEKGEGRIVVTLTDAKLGGDVREEGGKLIARFANTTITDALLRRLDVLDFATPVKYVDIARAGGDVRITLTPVAGAEFEQAAYQAGNQFTIELQPLSADKKEEKKKDQPTYTGERITLSFQSVDVRSLLQIIAEVAGTNMVVSDSVQGEVAMRLENVPWDQALDIILRTKGLGLRQQGNVMLVAPLEELAAREKAELEVAKSKVDLAPLRSEIIQVNYAKASDLAALLKSGDKNSIVSERGSVSVDDRTNTLLVNETREKLADVRLLVTRLDIPVRQVLIESRIVIANDDYSREIGSRFGVSTYRQNGGTSVLSSGSVNATDTQVTNILAGNPPGVGALADRFNVNLPATTAGAGRAGFAILGSNYLVDLELSALQSEGRGELVSSPRVITANSKEATIKSGAEIPFVTPATGNTPPTVSFKEALLSLTVTPFINPDNSIVMDLKVNRDEPDFTRLVQGNPPLNKREMQTSVLVQNGETVVLGGVYEQNVTEQRSKIPLLGDIPLLGALFRRDSNVSRKNELLIFVTPKILSENLSVE